MPDLWVVTHVMAVVHILVTLAVLWLLWRAMRGVWRQQPVRAALAFAMAAYLAGTVLRP